MELRRYEFTIDGSRGRPLSMSLDLPLNGANLPLMVFCHGFKGFKDWGAWPLMGATMAAHGVGCLRINFSMNGTTSEHPDSIEDPERFGHNNLSTELNDLGLVLDWLTSSADVPLERINKNSIHLAGHSRGGGIVLLKAVEDNRVRSVISLNGVADFEPYMHWIPQEEWRETGVSWVINQRTGQKLPMYWQFVEDFYQNRDRLDLPECIHSLSKPLLLCHAKDDNVVSFDAAQNIHNEVEHAILVEFESGGHTFGSSHPWKEASLPEPLDDVVSECVEFVLMNA